MADSFAIRVWSKSLPSRQHPERDEDLGWSAPNGRAHAVVDGMGSARRRTPTGEIGGEHAAHAIGEVLAARLTDLPADLAVADARDLLTATVLEAGQRIFRDINQSGHIPPEQVPEGKTVEDVMPAAVMTGAILCENARHAVIGQNGDTRAYLYSDGELILLTEDQDAVQGDHESGLLSDEQVQVIQDTLDSWDGRDISALDPVTRRYFVQRNLVFGEVGDNPQTPPPVLSVIELRPGDLLLLCSDGVYANLTTAEIRDSLGLIDPAAALVDRSDARSAERTLPDPSDLSKPYNYRAHQDDITAIVVKVEW